MNRNYITYVGTYSKRHCKHKTTKSLTPRPFLLTTNEIVYNTILRDGSFDFIGWPFHSIGESKYNIYII